VVPFSVFINLLCQRWGKRIRKSLYWIQLMLSSEIFKMKTSAVPLTYGWNIRNEDTNEILITEHCSHVVSRFLICWRSQIWISVHRPAFMTYFHGFTQLLQAQIEIVPCNWACHFLPQPYKWWQSQLTLCSWKKHVKIPSTQSSYCSECLEVHLCICEFSQPIFRSACPL
jgi:hypothetical protein